MRTFFLVPLLPATLLVGCGAHAGATTTTSAEIQGAKLEPKSAWTSSEMPDGSSVEDYAVGHELPQTAGASIYVVSRTRTERADGRADLTVSMSSDLGRTFLKLATIHDAPPRAHVFVAPADDRTVLVTAGESASGTPDADAPGALWRSTDGGVTFTRSAASDAPATIDVDPANHLVGATCHGVRRSMDGGATFARIDEVRAATLAQSGKDGSRIVGLLGITRPAKDAPRTLAVTVCSPPPWP